MGAGQTVAILELEPYDPSDIPTFEQCYTVNGQPINPQIANVPVDGGAAPAPGPGEAALDIENVIGAGAAGQDRRLRRARTRATARTTR